MLFHSHRGFLPWNLAPFPPNELSWQPWKKSENIAPQMADFLLREPQLTPGAPETHWKTNFLNFPQNLTWIQRICHLDCFLNFNLYVLVLLSLLSFQMFCPHNFVISIIDETQERRKDTYSFGLSSQVGGYVILSTSGEVPFVLSE